MSLTPPLQKQRDTVIHLIFEALDNLNQTLASERQLPKSLDAVLFGRRSRLDSLGLVNLIVAIEEGIQDKFATSISIADERALSQQDSPFRTVETLANYICLLLQGETDRDQLEKG